MPDALPQTPAVPPALRVADMPLAPWPGQQEKLAAGSLVFSSLHDGGNLGAVDFTVGDPWTPPPVSAFQRARAAHQVLFVAAPTDDSGSEAEDAAAATPQVDEQPSPTSEASEEIYQLWIAPDCAGTEHANKNRSWYYFRVSGGKPGRVVTFRVMNSNPHQKLYDLDMRPVFRCMPDGEWARLPHKVSHMTVAGNGVINIPFTFEGEGDVEIATTFPYTAAHLGNRIADWEERARKSIGGVPADVYFFHHRPSRTPDRLPIDVITLSSTSGCTGREPDLAGFGDKKHVFITARVHPGETPASHILDGLVEFLLSGEPEAQALRERFVFKIIPMLNPDGVRRGHSRSDQWGRNLNRHYAEPCSEQMPGIWLAREMFTELHTMGRLATYIDLHAHHSKRGCFFYGNCMEDMAAQVEVELLAAIFGALCPHFDVSACNFTKANMCWKDGRDESKEGSARVALYRQTGFGRTYTLECNYNTSNLATCSSLGGRSVRYDPPLLAGIGRSLAVSCLALLSPESEELCFPGDPGRVERLRAQVAERMQKAAAKRKKERPKRRVPQSGFMQAAGGREARDGVMIL
eukprot:TRINITY_DN32829_c0_g1_i1.p1 TRINITY_DN32829_c0_g1~~TRINITY_DN32829_c0_g1_i1.p1  ORF type:complete len:594 (+),score=179.44 TRINITY_DN32829_c0_g1_i1:53-1783(+)